MPIGQMRQTIFTDSNLSLFQQSITDQFSQVAKIPFMDGMLIKDYPLTSSTINTINHKLGRQALGYFIISNTVNTAIWNQAFSGDVNIVLSCSSDTTVSIWVF